MKKRQSTDNVMQTAAAMLCLTLVSKAIGFGRELVLAGAFGTSYVMDAYVLAQTIPTVLLGGVLAAVSTSYIPVYSKIRESRTERDGEGFTCGIINLTLFLALIIFILGAVFSDQIIAAFAANLAPQTAQLANFYLKVAFSYTIFSSTLAILESYLQYNGRFLTPIIGGYFYSIGIIVMAIVSARTDVRFLAFGVLLGHAMHFVVAYTAARWAGYHHRLEVPREYGGDLKQTLQLAVPMFFSSSIYSLNSFIDKTLASRLMEGSVAALNYGATLVTMITGMTTTIILTILYPKLAQAYNQNQRETYQGLVQKCSSILLLIGIPFMLGIMAFSQQVVQILYERGSFDAESTGLTGEAFFFYGVGIVFVILADFLARLYYTMQDTKTPILCSAISISVNIAINLLLIDVMAHRGLALASSIGAVVNVFFQSLFFRKKAPDLRVFPPRGKILRILLTAAVSVGAAMATYRLCGLIWMPRMVQLGLAVLVAGLVYLPLLKILKIEEVDLLKTLFNHGKDRRQS